MSSPLAPLADWVTAVVERLGYLGVALLVALETVFPPIPSELILPLAGFLCGQGEFVLPLMVLAATAGSVGGALTVYGISARLGEERFRSLVRRYGKWAAVGEADLDKAEGWFDRHGGLAVLICRLIPLARSFVDLPAGFRRMPLPRFVAYTALGSGLWNGALISAGWALGDRWDQAQRYAQVLEYALLAALFLAAVAWVVKRRRAKAGGRARESAA